MVLLTLSRESASRRGTGTQGLITAIIPPLRGDQDQDADDQDHDYANLLWLDRRKCLLLAPRGPSLLGLCPDIFKADLLLSGRSSRAILETR